MSTNIRMTRIIAAAAFMVLAGAGAASACSNGALPDGKGGCYYPPFASDSWYKQEARRKARLARMCARGMKWACPGPGPVVR